MNAAEELERMAEELERSTGSIRADLEQRMSPASRHARVRLEAVAAERAATVKRLRERAAELRQQRSGPTHEPQSKPAEVKVGQWWCYLGASDWRGEPGRVDHVLTWKALGWTHGGAIRWEAYMREMLTDPCWLYLGDGEQPGLVGSEVAGEEER